VNSWIYRYPQWYISERKGILRRYPDFQIDRKLLSLGIVRYYGELLVRPQGGTHRHPICLAYPEATPYSLPVVTPLRELPTLDSENHPTAELIAEFFNRRHQMPGGGLCLFQHETRGAEGGEAISALDVLTRAENWFNGHHTGRWPPDSRDSELETHFTQAGQILLSRRFFEPDIVGHGRFHFVRDIARILIQRIADHPPLVMTAIVVSTGGVDTVLDARKDLQGIFPWLENDAWGVEALGESEGIQFDDSDWKPGVRTGFWWTLDEEPSPFRDGAGLLRELNKIAEQGDGWRMVAQSLGGSLATESEHVIGLRYPGRQGSKEWLILSLRTPEKTKAGGGVLLVNDNEKRATFEKARVACYRGYSAQPAVLHLRNTTVVNESVRSKCVAMVGLGALGSKVAELFAQAGVAAFELCDNDVLTTANIARHVGGLRDFGALKTRVMATRLRDINCNLAVHIYDHSITSNLENLEALLERADLTICTTGDENVESAINQVAMSLDKTVLYGRALRRGSMGRVFLVRRGRDACKSCLAQFAAEYQTSGWLNIVERKEDVLLHECGRPVIPASAIDLSFIASLIARKALSFLEGDNADENHWVWSRDLAKEIAPGFDRPFTVLSAEWKPLAHCLTCRRHLLIDITLSDGVSDFIRAEVESSSDAETGGILIGYTDGQSVVVVKATGPGPKAKRSRTRLERDVEYVQRQLDDAEKALGSKGRYVGEWHSHLESDPKPSGRDLESMCGIADAPNYETQCPAMIIAGTDTVTGRLTQLKSWMFPTGGSLYPIAIADQSAGNSTSPSVE
jgi:integrative and conjugative element protein (TIGR02256 family)